MQHDDPKKELERDRPAEDHEGGEKVPCGCEPGGWVVMNADAERGLLGQVQRCDACGTLKSEEEAWALAEAAGYLLDVDGNVMAVPKPLDPPPPRRHELKTRPAEFQTVLDGKKRHEVRYDKRAFQTGDAVRLREWDPRYRDAQNPFSGAATRQARLVGPSGGCMHEIFERDRVDETRFGDRLRHAVSRFGLVAPSDLLDTWTRDQYRKIGTSLSELADAIDADRDAYRSHLLGLCAEQEAEHFFDLRRRFEKVVARIAVTGTAPDRWNAGVRATVRREVVEVGELLSECDVIFGVGDGAAARQTREERADKAAVGREPGRVEGVDRG